MTPAKAVAAFGEPDRKLGSGLIIYEYDLEDGSKIRLGFPVVAPMVIPEDELFCQGHFRIRHQGIVPVLG